MKQGGVVGCMDGVMRHGSMCGKSRLGGGKRLAGNGRENSRREGGRGVVVRKIREPEGGEKEGRSR